MTPRDDGVFLASTHVMNFVDLLLGAIVLLSILTGWRRGLLSAGADVLALAASMISAFFLYRHVVAFAEGYGLQSGVWTAPLAFLAVFVAARLLLGLLLSRALRRVAPTTHAHGANRALGVIPGAANGLINATIASMLLISLPLSDGITREASESTLARHFAVPGQWLEAKLGPIFEPAIDRSLTKLTVPPESRALVKLPFTVQDPKHRPDLETRMIALLNEERRTQGLRPLQADPEAAAVARAHSEDMFERGYFSHVTPDGKDPFERMRGAGLRFLTAGENLSLARTLPMAHQGLMDSPGHRANILRPNFGRVGIGIVDGGRYGLIVTQNFRN
jgi:uncharacterized protein YkwD